MHAVALVSVFDPTCYTVAGTTNGADNSGLAGLTINRFAHWEFVLAFGASDLQRSNNLLYYFS